MVDSCWLKKILPFNSGGVLTNELLTFRNLFKRGKWLFGISLFIRGENDGKNLEARLEKKRQLAVLLQSRFPTLPTQEEWGDSWQKGTTGMSRGWLSLQEDSLTAMPLEEAVNEYSTLLQENLMEKAMEWKSICK